MRLSQSARLLPFLLLTLALLPFDSRARADDTPLLPRDPDMAQAMARRLVQGIRNAERIVVGRVHEVHESPGIWCGGIMTEQKVTYDVVETLAGAERPERVTVSHLLVHGSRLVHREQACLDPAILHPGARVVLTLSRREGDGVVVLDEDVGAWPLGARAAEAPGLIGLVRALVSAPGLRPFLHAEVEGRLPVPVSFPEGIAPPCSLPGVLEGIRIVARDAYPELPVLQLESLETGRDVTTARFRYPVEGLAGTATFSRDAQGRMSLTALDLAERR